MKEEDEKERGFKVQDRRRFSAEGDIKSEAEDAPEKPAPEKPATIVGAGPEPQAGAAIGAESGAAPAHQQSSQHPESGRHPESSRHSAQEAEINFATFLVGLSSEALGALGELPDPSTGQAQRDLHAAQQLIDIIGMLRDKTRGNLDQTEQSLIDAILFDLRMKYVELARQPAR